MSNIEIWQTVAEDVLAPLLVEQYTKGNSKFFDKAQYSMGLSSYHFPPGRWRSLYSGIVRLRHEKKVVNWNNLVSIVSSTVSEEWFTSVTLLAGPVREIDFESNVEKLIDVGSTMLIVEALESGAQELRKGADRQSIVEGVIGDITSAGEKRIENETAKGAASRVDTIFENEPIKGVPTGIQELDEEIGGLSDEQMVILSGAYKGRKTTCMLNWVINALRQGKKPAVLSFENSIEMTTLQLIALLAVEKLLKENPYHPESNLFWIGAMSLKRAGKDYKKWDKRKVEAIDYARDTLRDYGDQLRIYDRSDKGGSLYDIPSVKTVITRDMHLYGGDFYGLDHQNLIEARKGGIYEDIRSVSGDLQAISRTTSPHRLHLLVLAQLNEASISNSNGYSAGIKGGGDSNANADFVIRNIPVKDPNAGKGKYYNDRIDMEVKLARFGASTERIRVFFHPQSGLLMPEEVGTPVPLNEKEEQIDPSFF